MGYYFRIFSAITSRLIFVSHAIWSLRATIYRRNIADEEKAKNDDYWTLTIVLGFIFMEGTYAVVIRKGHEYKFFWPSGFFYIVIMIPITCLLEIFLLEEELQCASVEGNTLLVGNVTEEQKLSLKRYCNLRTETNLNDQKIRSGIEIGMLGTLVLGRWLLPRGELTRDQLSALLLNFISNGADVVEFLNTWNDFPVLRTRPVVYSVLAIYSWSLLQFTIVTTKTTDEYSEEEDGSEFAEFDMDVMLDITVTQYEDEEVLPKPLSPKRKERRRLENSDPNLPRYLQKLAKKNNRYNVRKADSKTRMRAATIGGVSTGRRNTNRMDAVNRKMQTVGAFRKPRSLTARSSGSYSPSPRRKLTRRRTPLLTPSPVPRRHTLSPHDVGSNNNNVVFDFSSPKAVDLVRREKSMTQSTVLSNESFEPTPAYLKTLAKYERWDEFSEALSRAQANGFNMPLGKSFTSEGDTDGLDLTEDSDFEEEERGYCSSKFNQDVFQILVLLVSLEVPYFIARVFFTAFYNVSSITMVFYTAKNVIMIIFLIYRLWVIFSGLTEDDELAENEGEQVDALAMR